MEAYVQSAFFQGMCQIFMEKFTNARIQAKHSKHGLVKNGVQWDGVQTQNRIDNLFGLQKPKPIFIEELKAV